MAQLLHSQVSAAERATVVSIQSLIGYLGGAVGAVALGQLAAVTSMAVAFGVAAVLLAVPGWLLVTAPTPTRAENPVEV